MVAKYDRDNPTRRAVLRRGVATTAAIGVGVPLFSASAYAHDCPRTPGFWANHNWCAYDAIADSDSLQSKGLDCSNPETAKFELQRTGVAKTISEWQAFLLEPTHGDAVTKMAQTLLASVLNFQFVSGCADETVDLSGYGVDETTVRDVKRRAEYWLRQSTFGNGTGDKRDWTAGGFDGEPYKDVLDAFNNGELDIDCPPCEPVPDGAKPNGPNNDDKDEKDDDEYEKDDDYDDEYEKDDDEYEKDDGDEDDDSDEPETRGGSNGAGPPAMTRDVLHSRRVGFDIRSWL